MPQYIETFSDLMRVRVDEWIGRCYARSVGQPYPIPVESEHCIGNGYYYKTAKLKEAAPGKTKPLPPGGGQTGSEAMSPGGVFELDDTILAFSHVQVQLSDNSYFVHDIHTAAKNFEDLSPEGQAAVNRVQTPPPAADQAEAPTQTPEAPPAPTQNPEEPTTEPPAPTQKPAC